MLPLATVPAPCPPPGEVRRAYVAAVGPNALARYHLSGRGAGTRTEAWIGNGELLISQNERGFRQSWSDTVSTSTHTLPNGFEGRALPWRVSARYAAVRALLGELTAVEPVSVRCVREHRIRRPVLDYNVNGVRVPIALDPASSLPHRIQAFSPEHRFAGTWFTGISYRRVAGVAVPFAWQTPFQRFAFQSANLWAAPPTLPAIAVRPPISHRVLIPAIRPLAANQTAVSVTVEGHRFRFFVDSGATVTVIDERVAALLRLKRVGHGRTLQITGAVRADPAFIPAMRIGPLRLKNEPVLIAQQTFGYDGMIGSSLFALGKVTLTKHGVVLEPRTAAMLARHAIRIDTYDGIPFATARVGRKTADVLLDSGAAFEGLLPSRFIGRARLLAKQTSVCNIYGVPHWMVAGYFSVAGLQFGSQPWPVRACLSYGDQIHFVDGILGHAALIEAGATFDYLDGTVTLRRTRK